MYALTIYYSFDIEHPVILFESRDAAKEALKDDFEKEVKLQIEENKAEVHTNHTADYDYAELVWADSERIEWKVSEVEDERRPLESIEDAVATLCKYCEKQLNGGDCDGCYVSVLLDAAQKQYTGAEGGGLS